MMMKQWEFGLLVAVLASTFSFAAEFKEGMAVDVDAKAGTFSLLVPVAYDPADVKPAELLKVKMRPGAEMVLRSSLEDHKEISPRTLAKIFMNKENRELLDAGKSFEASRIQMEPGLKLQENGAIPVLPITMKENRKGVVQFKDREISFFCYYFFRHSILPISEIEPGITSIRAYGVREDQTFLASYAEVTILPDPRKTDNPKLPRVLVIGDSISMNYHNAAEAALKGLFNYHRISGNAGDSVKGNQNLELWLGPMKETWQKWDVVVINHGLHDLRQPCAKNSKLFPAKHQVEPEAYGKNMDNLLKCLSRYPFKVVVCTTTPVPNDDYSSTGRRKDEDLKYNAVLLEVLKKYPQIELCDLNQLVRSSSVFDNWRKGNNVHFIGKEQLVLGNAVAEAVKKAVK